MRRTYILIALFFGLALSAISQDTLKIMQYNLLYYGKNVYDCNSTNNNIDNKNTNLRTILAYAKPDIFCVNEMDASLSDVDYLMDNVLNIDGISSWKHANISGSYSINMIYYNSDIFELMSQASINASPRQTNVYHMKHITSNTEFTVFVAHLKAGSQASDEDDKAAATQNVMNYIASQGPGNYLFEGDLNLYTSASQAFQNLVNPANTNLAFQDPANRVGDWSNNYNFSDVHTQSTHTSGDCFVTGGMDDRFDFILASKDIMEGNNEIKYLASSYETIGQDGNHYNNALIDGTNNAAPSNVINALYNTSDHLPVSMEMVFGLSSAPITLFNKTFDDQDLTSGGWRQYSVTDSNLVWNIPTNTNGHNGTYYGEMSGYDYANSTSVQNEDWLISPAFNADETLSETLTFWTAGKYSGNDLQVYYSSNYDGVSNPNTATWSEITGFNLSTTADYTWESSGNIDISNIVGENVRIAFKYTSTDTESRKWQIDDILLVGTNSNASVNEVKSEKLFSIYPNPSQDILVVETNSLNDQNGQIYNIQGQIIKSFIIKGLQTKISVADWPSGIYFVKIGNNVQKLIVSD